MNPGRPHRDVGRHGQSAGFARKFEAPEVYQIAQVIRSQGGISWTALQFIEEQVQSRLPLGSNLRLAGFERRRPSQLELRG